MIRTLFRLPWFIYAGLAPLIAAFGVWLYFDQVGDDAERAKLMAGPVPQAVSVDKLDPAKLTGRYREVVVTAQLDAANMMELTKSKNGNVRDRTVFAPLLAPLETNKSAKARYAFAAEGGMSDAEIEKLVIVEGPLGPIVRVHGLISDDFGLIGDAREALQSSGRYTGDPVPISVFTRGRAAALAPQGDAGGLLTVALIAAALIGLYGWIRWLRSRPDDALEDAGAIGTAA